MMRIDILSAVPDLLYSPLNTSIIKRAQDKGKVQIVVHNLRDYSGNKHKQIDDKPFGGASGMLLKPEPFFECIEKLQSEREYDHIIFLTPRGRVFDQGEAKKLSLCKNVILIAGHYKGIDERVIRKFVTYELSVGKFVLSGGELPVLIVTDAIIRLLPGVLNDMESALDDSLADGDYIEAPFYTRPAQYRNMNVPDVLLSGNTKAIDDWKEEQSKILTEKWKKINSLE
ncbi:MAG: tRNA (guanosine(37)-N1)-methyltransferase TrmD [Melioribacteraceae bacterium]|nr:tRNA (guanosine(37)-N1)-methyltransferase TrmD [Melioribacteraceae bacterium]